MWPFKRKKWAKLGVARDGKGLRSILENGLITMIIDLRDTAYRSIPLDDFKQLMFDARPSGDPIAYVAEAYDCDLVMWRSATDNLKIIPSDVKLRRIKWTS